MACTDAKTREFMNVPVGATYELSVNGPAGFAAFAQFDEDGTTLEVWKSQQITPGPRTRDLDGAGSVHFVVVSLTIDPTQHIEVTVQAKVAGKSFCRTVTTSEMIIHTIRMASA